MIVVGERINGTRKRVHKAVIERDAAHIEQEAKLQAEAGADYIDVNAGTTPDREPEDSSGFVKTVQEAVALPCCIDTPNPWRWPPRSKPTRASPSSIPSPASPSASRRYCPSSSPTRHR